MSRLNIRCGIIQCCDNTNAMTTYKHVCESVIYANKLSATNDKQIDRNTDYIVTPEIVKDKQTKLMINYIKTCVKRPLSKRPKIGFQDQL